MPEKQHETKMKDLTRRLEEISDLVDDAMFIESGLFEAVSKEQRAVFASYSRELKKKLQKDLGIQLKTKVMSSAKGDPFIEIGAASGVIPKEFRMKAIDIAGASGNIDENHITMRYSQWMKLVGPLENTSKPTVRREKEATTSGEELYTHLKDIVDTHQNKVIPGIGRVDAFTASAVVSVANKLNQANREKFLNMPFEKMADTAMKLIK